MSVSRDPTPPAENAPRPPRVVVDGVPARRGLGRRLVASLAFLVLAAALAGAAAAALAWRHFSGGLPDIPTLAEYRPPIVTELVSSDGQLAGELFDERRKVVPFDRIPKRLVQALVASEDKNFFEHRGVDWLGTLRAAVNTFVLRRKVQGGSTITQQTAKSLLVSAEGFEEGTRRNLRRKIRELILARRLEAAFDKQEILWLYLNGVYLGHHSYGVQAAAENYFRKNVEDLTLAEAALLAGLPQAPTKYSPFTHPDSAKARRRYVVRRMYEDGAITAEERVAAEENEVKVYPVDDVFRETAPFYVEQVRRQLVDRYGNDRILHDGLRVEMAMDLEKQRGAQAAMLSGLMEVDHRQGYGGPVTHVEGEERDALAAKLARTWPPGALGPGDYAVGIVTAVDDRAALARIAIGTVEGVLPIAGMRWARKPNPEQNYPDALISRPSTALHEGDVVLVRRVEKGELLAREPKERQKLVPDAPVLLALEQEPKLQGALVSIEPFTGHVPAMVGGYDFDASEFNRAFQACRQPGSAFKPIVYSGAIEKLGYTPATLLTDAPVVYRDEAAGVSWKPENFGGSFKGEVTLRDALVHSMNLPAVKVAAALGVDQLVSWAQTVGLGTPVKRELGSAIGSSCTTLWGLANVYALLDRYGEKRASTFVKRVQDRDGRLLEDHGAPADAWVPLTARLAAAAASVRMPVERVMDPRSAYITVSLLHEVATVGTGAQAARLGKPAAGKTGTTNDSFDTWFLGFTHDLFAGVWLGYDANEMPLGRYETGGRAALPIWLSYMQGALRDRPQPEFPVPDGIEFVAIDPATGQLATEASKAVIEPFKAESRPVENPPDKPRLEVQDLFGQ
ncbi:MAG TPA: PBP1A family penicillin-binding protein [Anaeromyxobacteraceae bacterium]